MLKTHRRHSQPRGDTLAKATRGSLSSGSSKPVMGLECPESWSRASLHYTSLIVVFGYFIFIRETWLAGIRHTTITLFHSKC